MARIVSIGAAVQDVFLSNSPDFKPVADKDDNEELFFQLELGAKVDVNRVNFSTGGGATNASVTFARQGHEAIFMGTVGKDPAGEAVIQELDKENVDTRYMSYSDVLNTGYSVLLLANSGERTILTYRGASTHYDIKNFDLEDADADWLYVSSLAGNMDILDKLFTQARQEDMKIAFNPGKGELSNPDKLKGLLEDVEVLIANKDEAAQVVSGTESEELVRRLLSYVPVAIVSDGPNGVVASDGKTIITAGMYEDVEVIDRTGAGDAFGSGFVSYWAREKSLRESIVFASANSTSVVQQIGAKAGILKQNVVLHDMPLTEEAL